MSRPGIHQKINTDRDALNNDPRAIFLHDLKKTQFYIQSFSAVTQQLLKIAVNDDYSNPNMVRLLHQVMNLVYEITKWIYTLMKRDETPNEHCMKLLDKVAKQASQVVETFKQAVLAEQKSMNILFISKFMSMTELIHKILDDFLIYGNPVFLDVLRNSDASLNDKLKSKQSERRVSVGSQIANKFPTPISPKFDKRRSSADSAILPPKTAVKIKSPLAQEFQLPKELDDQLKRSSSDVEQLERKMRTAENSPLTREVPQQQYIDFPSDGNLATSRRSSVRDQSPRNSPRSPRKAVSQIPEEHQHHKLFNEYISRGLPLIQQAKDKRITDRFVESEIDYSNRNSMNLDSRGSPQMSRLSTSVLNQHSVDMSPSEYISPAMLAEESFRFNMQEAQKTVDTLTNHDQPSSTRYTGKNPVRLSEMYPDISFRPAQSVHIQNFDLSVFGTQDRPHQLQDTPKKLNKSREGLQNLKWKSETLMREETLERRSSSSGRSLNKNSSENSLFSTTTFLFENHLFKETRVSLKSKCDQCEKKLNPFQKRLSCKKCGYLMHSSCFKVFDGRQCSK